MSLTCEQKLETIKEVRRSDADVGSSEVQVALMTKRIQYLTAHFKVNKNDVHSRRGLQALVNKRRKLLKYLKRKNLTRYQILIAGLGLRDSY